MEQRQPRHIPGRTIDLSRADKLIPLSALKTAVDEFEKVEKPREYGVWFDEEGDNWVVFFWPLNRRMRGSDVEVWITKDTLAVTEVVLGQ